MQRVELHPAYRSVLEADLAIVTLDRNVERIRPAPINDFSSLQPGQPGAIVGFGRAGGDLQDSGVKDVGLVSLDECNGLVQQDTHLCWKFDFPIGPEGEDSNTCNSDSGGPLFVDLGEGFALAGVTSAGQNDTCLPPDLSWDTNVFSYHDWIASIAGGDLGRSCGATPRLGPLLAEPGTEIRFGSGVVSASNQIAAFEFEVPAGATLLRVALNGADEVFPDVPNDFDLYVRAGTPPLPGEYDCGDESVGPYGYCEFSNPSPGRWYMVAALYQGAGLFQLTASIFGSAPPPTPKLPCLGDCDSSGWLSVDELVSGIGIALGSMPLAMCPSFDANRDAKVTIDELTMAVGASVHGCES